MDVGDEETLESHECEPLVRTTKAQVAIKRDLLKQYEAIPEQKRARFSAIMRRWCDGVSLTPEMFNANEGRSPKGILLQAVKGFKVRLYGFRRKFSNRETFVIVEIDPAKKQDKADPRVLKKAMRKVDEIGKG